MWIAQHCKVSSYFVQARASTSRHHLGLFHAWQLQTSADSDLCHRSSSGKDNYDDTQVDNAQMPKSPDSKFLGITIACVVNIRASISFSECDNDVNQSSLISTTSKSHLLLVHSGATFSDF